MSPIKRKLGIKCYNVYYTPTELYFQICFALLIADIAVGSYLSNHAVLLRSRPIINVTATLELLPKAVDPDTNCNIIGMRVPCIRVKICFFYSGVGEGIPTEIGKYN